MKVVKKTGLVPVYTKNDADTVFGVPPQSAIEGVKAGTLFLFQIPDDVETFEIADGKPVAAVSEKPEAPAVVQIPENWESLHHATIIRLAKDILGDAFVVPDGKTAKEVAIEEIADEVERRAAAVAEAEAAGDS